MTHTSLKHRVLPLAFAGVTAAGLLSTSSTLAATTTKATYKGPTVDERWGTVQVSIVVKNKKITSVKAAYAVENPRSEFITSNALPQLKQEVLDAQTVNIDTVSGASDVSEAYVTSLQSAVKKAIKAKTLTTKALK